MLTDPKKETADIVDIDLSPIRKKRFRINGDSSRILELNVSDMNIFVRLNEAFPKLEKLATEAVQQLPSDDDESTDDVEFIGKVADSLKKIDTSMREQLDFIFDSNVSEVCAPDGSMYDPFNGKLRYEHILETISTLYENNFSDEVQKITQRVNKHTAKYTKSNKQRKK